MKTLNNPFLVFGYHSPAYFCNREKETREIVDALQNGRNLTLTAPRRIGKQGLYIMFSMNFRSSISGE